ncbi:MAG: acylphosphatase [Acidobacteria bacterium]|nr:acylphosphatase [Acidobacteriota bacterium]
MKQRKDTARLYWVRGLVQGVGYRYFVQRAANELDLAGYVKNLDDGRVEVYAVGTAENLEELASRLKVGPAYADVRGVDEEPAPVHSVSSFRIEPSW